ncbi:MAG: alpha/beta hydrolase [Anaerolineales bacterium]|nr:alpha/beta hydrolase [Anaerolineales bacterium]
MEIVKVSGIELAYTRRGTGKPLMLIHGFPLDHTSWNEAASLLENDFDLLLPDLRGFGKSTTVAGPYSMSDMADDLAALLDHLGIEKTVIVGHSMGGYVALAFARKYPQRVSGLALVSSQAAADPPDRKEGRYKTAQDVTEKGVGVVAEAMTPKFSANADVQAFAKAVIQKQSQAGVSGALKAMAEREDATTLLPAFKFPVVLVHGSADALIPAERAQEIKAILPAAQLVMIEGAGHVPMMEFPKETAEALKRLG